MITVTESSPSILPQVETDKLKSHILALEANVYSAQRGYEVPTSELSILMNKLKQAEVGCFKFSMQYLLDSH